MDDFSEHLSADFSEEDETIKEMDWDDSINDFESTSPCPFKYIIGKSEHLIDESDNTIIENVGKEPILVILKNQIMKRSNTIRLKVVKFSSQDLYVGVLKLKSDKSFDMVWSYCLPTGKSRWIGAAGHTTINEYVKKWETKYKSGSTLEMIIEKGEMSFMMNSRPLGVAFWDERMQDKNIYAYIRLGHKDAMQVLNVN